MDDTPNLKIPYILAAQAQKHVTHNEAVRALDAIVQLSVIDRDLTAPPPSPSDGDRYIVGASATNEWSGQSGRIAAFQDNAWMFYQPLEGWLAWVADEGRLTAFDGTDWSEVSSGDGSVNPVAFVGVNTVASNPNKLAVKSDAVLFSHDDVTPGTGDIQAKLNKAGEGDTATFLFQNNWSGRAEIGLSGDDHFHFKVSPDGSTWHEALTIEKDTGLSKVKQFRTDAVLVTNDTVATIPTPSSGGIIIINYTHPTFPQASHTGIFAYDTGSTLDLKELVMLSGMTNQDNAVLTGTTGPDSKTNVAVSTGHIQIENRRGFNAKYSYTFIG